VIARALMVVFLLAGAGAARAGPSIRPERVVIVELRDVGVGMGRELGHHDGRTRHGGRTRPILMLGGEVPLARSVSLVSENWLVRDVPLKEQPFGLALRFHGRRLSADVGVILVGEVLKEGFPLPWVSVSYHFGRTRPRERAPMAASGYRSVVGQGSRTSQ
jgi:hypothetical protein